ncbi:AAA family ATPase [Desulfuromonas acetoxidans]|uniref:AAA family ATPase n=1 Tax=Desulfuromonas acetoxidans TaxID=891 RepID=UPI0002D7A9F8|nr:AAA family ATPase [Desulfuromonas acetoxidans]
MQEIYLKKLLADANISQREFGPMVGVSGTTINLICNKNYIPTTMTGFEQHIEKFIRENEDMMAVLNREKRDVKSIWQPLKGCHMNKIKPASNGVNKPAAMVPGNNQDETEIKEVSMLTDGARKQFKLFRHPFIDDILKDSDIFMSDEHRYIEAAMLDAARHGGFLAVIGEVGSGKSVMRRKVIEQLKRDGDVLVIYPQVIDKERVTAGSICDAIIYDISNEKPKQRLEAKSRQVQRLLLDRSRNGFRHVIILEESHDLSVPVLKYLKRFHELEDGYKKMLGIILVAQTELKSRFTESQNIDMREVIQRVQIAEIHGLNGSLKGYLKVKFERLGVKLDSIFTDDAFDMISSRLTTQDDSRRKVSLAHPLRVNSLVIDAINLAHEMGEERVTGDVIQALY